MGKRLEPQEYWIASAKLGSIFFIFPVHTLACPWEYFDKTSKFSSQSVWVKKKLLIKDCTKLNTK